MKYQKYVTTSQLTNYQSTPQNPTKCIFFYHQNQANPGAAVINQVIGGIPLKINGQKIQRVTKFNFLGILFTSTMSWKAHTDKISSKIGRSIGMLNRLKFFIPGYVRKMLYSSLIHSHLTYGILAWGFNPGRLPTLQKKAIRAVVGARYNSHTEPMFKFLKILTVKDIFTLRCLKFLYNLKNNLCPHYLKQMFITAGETHGYNTRGAGVFHVKTTNTQGATNCLRHYIPNHIEKFDKRVTDKISTHSPEGFSNYAKNFILESYKDHVECDRGPTCFSCYGRPS